MLDQNEELYAHISSKESYLSSNDGKFQVPLERIRNSLRMKVKIRKAKKQHFLDPRSIVLDDRNVLQTVWPDNFEPYWFAPVSQETLYEHPEMQEGANADGDSEAVIDGDDGDQVFIGPIDMTNRANFAPGQGPGSSVKEMKALCTQWSVPCWGHEATDLEKID